MTCEFLLLTFGLCLEQQTNAHYGRVGVECGSAGECFFQSLARQLSLGGPHTENNYDARALRRLVDEQLTGMLIYQSHDLLNAVGEEVFDNITAYLDLDEKLRDREWADDFMISIIAAYLNINIRITNATNLTEQYTIGNDPNAHTFDLLYYPGLHYQSFEVTADAPPTRSIIVPAVTKGKARATKYAKATTISQAPSTTSTITVTRKRKARSEKDSDDAQKKRTKK